MSSAVEQHCTVLMHHEDLAYSSGELRAKLESAKLEDKVAALKAVILLVLNGEPQPNMLMPVIKYCLNSEDHVLKKLLYVFWESVDKTDSKGTLLPEMILVCNAIRNDLQHANEYVRGSTLRFLCKIHHPEILESLIPTITDNLEHRHSYVRKNAVLAVFEIYQNYPELIPDATHLIVNLLENEPNLEARRNAFLMLFHCSIDRAAAYLDANMTNLATFGESFQMVALELVRKMCRLDPRSKSRYLRCVFSLLSSSNTVSYEAANTLLSLSSAPTAVRSCISSLAMLLTAESDHNVKLIILERLESLHGRHEKLLQDSLMDILRVLATPNIDIRKKVLTLTNRLISQRNISDVVNFLKKEMLLLDSSPEPSTAYRTILTATLYECALRFPDVAGTVVRVLLNYIGDESGNGALEVMFFVRGLVQEYEELRPVVLDRLVIAFDSIKTAVVYRVALWVLGEFSLTVEDIAKAKRAIVQSLEPLPLGSVQAAVEEAEGAASHPEAPTVSTSSKPVVLADGTYAQQSAVEELVPAEPVEDVEVGSKLRSLIIHGDYFVVSALCNALTKLVLREVEIGVASAQQLNTSLAQAMWIMSSILRYGQSRSASRKIDADAIDRIGRCIAACLRPQRYCDIFLRKSREVFDSMIEQRRQIKDTESTEGAQVHAEVDELISIRQLQSRFSLGEFGFEDDDADLDKAVGNLVLGDDIRQVDRVFQLTGYSDPVYGEARVTVHEYDIVLDILLINQTPRTLQNLSIELSTSGDLKLVERPQGHTIGAHASKTIQANIKVSSTESGVIFGNIVYDASGLTEKQIVVMNSVHMDIMDYILPSTCTETEFRSMWAEFEWENKVPVNTEIASLDDYVSHVVNLTNMACLTDRSAFSSGGCNFLSVNMCARSIFKEDALMNVSVEKNKGTQRIMGYIRIRSKTQGIALSLGDRITAHQRLQTQQQQQRS